MRKVTRPAEPQVLQEHSERFNAQWVSLREQNPSAQFQWYSHNKQDVRTMILPALRDMTAGHCSFCDSFPLDLGDENVEHFRPKSDPQYASLAYTWTNLYLICTTCNSSFKLAEFDEKMIAPDEEGYAFHNYFFFDSSTGAMMPHPSASPEAQSRATTTIEGYGLDHAHRRKLRKLEARKWDRSQADADPPNIDDYAYRDFLESSVL